MRQPISSGRHSIVTSSPSLARNQLRRPLHCQREQFSDPGGASENTLIARKKGVAPLLASDVYVLRIDHVQPKVEQRAVLRIVLDQGTSDPSARVAVAMHAYELIPANYLDLL